MSDHESARQAQKRGIRHVAFQEFETTYFVKSGPHAPENKVLIKSVVHAIQVQQTGWRGGQ